MIRINQIKCIPEQVTMPDGSMDKELLAQKAAAYMRIARERIDRLFIRRRSIDARKKPNIFYIFSVDVVLTGMTDEQFLGRNRLPDCSKSSWVDYTFPNEGKTTLSERPVIVGMGPAGLFCAYELALHGYRPVLLERGRDVDARCRDVERFWRDGVLHPDSNIQFGEGGAGTFSDGKLNTLIKDRDGRSAEVLRIFMEHGAKEDICYDAKPHLGTDTLCGIVKSMREKIIALGGEVHFETKMIGFRAEGGEVKAVKTMCGGSVRDAAKADQGECEDVLPSTDGEGERWIPCGSLVLAIGHSARDTVQMLYEMGIAMEAKPFAVGLRVEHPQRFINESQYGKQDAGILGAAAYKLTAQTKSGRGVYTFCMCPGGYVVSASSEPEMLAVNGMSYSGRDGENANSAVIVTVNPEDYGDGSPLSGIAFQRDLERRAFEIGNGKIPVERYGDYKADLCTGGGTDGIGTKVRGGARGGGPSADSADGAWKPCTKGSYTYAKVSEILPKELAEAFVEGMESFGEKIPGFNDNRTLVEGVESRTSSSVRILRNEALACPAAENVFPCGEGAGYAGGILSAAMDGVRVAEAVAGRMDFFSGM